MCEGIRVVVGMCLVLSGRTMGARSCLILDGHGNVGIGRLCVYRTVDGFDGCGSVERLLLFRLLAVVMLRLLLVAVATKIAELAEPVAATADDRGGNGKRCAGGEKSATIEGAWQMMNQGCH